MDESKVYFPPDKLQLPDTMITNSDSAFSMPDSDDAGDSDSDSSAPASPAYAPEPDPEPISLNNPRVDNRVSLSTCHMIIYHPLSFWKWTISSLENCRAGLQEHIYFWPCMGISDGLPVPF